MQKIIFIFSFLLIAKFSFAQINLVPNFSFEQYDTCPSFGGQIQFATGWSKYSNSASTPDYFNACAPANSLGVPKSNFYGFQLAHRNCNAYAGIGTWTSVNEREHIGIQLSQPLIIGQKYYISFYTVMCEIFYVSTGQYLGMPSNNIGIRLSTVTYNGSNPAPINNFAHLYSSVIINDSINWIRISGSIIADSAYDYLIVGNFFDNANTDTLNYNCPTCLNFGSFYWVDDICVSTDSFLCNGGIDLLTCDVSVSEIVFDDGITMFPNPASDFVNVKFRNNLSAKIMLYDVFEKIMYLGRIENDNSLSINLSSFSSGTYILKIIDESNNNSFIKKIIKL